MSAVGGQPPFGQNRRSRALTAGAKRRRVCKPVLHSKNSCQRACFLLLHFTFPPWGGGKGGRTCKENEGLPYGNTVKYGVNKERLGISMFFWNTNPLYGGYAL